MKLENQTAVVTGGSRGIGRAVCLELAREGANVVVCYAGRAEAAQKTAADCRAMGVKALAIQADVAEEAAVQSLFAQTLEAFWPGGYSGQQRRDYPGRPDDAHEPGGF